MRSIVLFLAFALLFNIATPHNLRDSDVSDVLSAHNAERIAFGLSGNQLVWNDDLANEASTWAENCVWGFSSGNYGQNLAFVTKTNDVFPTCGNQVQQQWTVQKQDWSCETNICSGQYCGSYTQMIWKDTTEIGCGVTTCPAGSIENEDTQFLVCFYSVAGNVETQHPLACAVDEAPPSCNYVPPQNSIQPPPAVVPPPPPSSGKYYAVSDSATDSSSASGLTLGVWIGICIGCSALTALVVGLITYFLVSKRVDYSNRV